MKSAMETSIVFAERIRGLGVIIEFDDGTSALYSASLLRSMLPQSTILEAPTNGELIHDDSKSDNAD
jgi:hypothetical protein